jgi:hypothetical protein
VTERRCVLHAGINCLCAGMEAENQRLRAFVQRIIDMDVPDGDEAAALNALKWAAALALGRPKQ